MLQDVIPGQWGDRSGFGNEVREPIQLGDWIYYRGRGEGTGGELELWRSNGVDIFELVADINPNDGSFPTAFHILDGDLVFLAGK